MKSLSVFLILTLILCSCATGSGLPETVVEQLQKSLIVIHDTLYVPISIALGKKLDEGGVSPAWERRIQAASVQYQTAKSGAATVIAAWGAPDSEILLRARLADMLSAVAELQTAKAAGGGDGAAGLRTIRPGPGEITACYGSICYSVDPLTQKVTTNDG